MKKLDYHEQLIQLDNKLDNFRYLEKSIYEKDNIIEELTTKMKNMEIRLTKKDDQIGDLEKKLETIEEKLNTLEIDVRGSETDQTFLNPSVIMKS